MNERQPIEVSLLRSVFLAITMGSLTMGALGAIWLVLSQDFDRVRGPQIMMTPMVGMIGGAIGLMSAITLHKRRLVVLMRFTSLMTLLTTVYWLYFIWGRGELSAFQEARVLLTLTLATFGLTVTGQLLAAQTSSTILVMARWGVVASADAFLLSMIMLTWTRWWYPHDRLVAMSSTIWGGFTLIGLLGVAAALRGSSRQRRLTSESISTRATLKMTCPNCGFAQVVNQGVARCSACHFSVIVEIEEPRCECGYLLYQLQGDRCPECGRDIPEALRWTPAAQSSAAGENPSMVG